MAQFGAGLPFAQDLRAAGVSSVVGSVRCRWWLVCALAALAVTGCARTRYIHRADKDTYGILAATTEFTPWRLPWNFNVLPDPRSRFHDPTPIQDPLLPIPSPNLYAYDLPELSPRDPERFFNASPQSLASIVSIADYTPSPSGESGPVPDTSVRLVTHLEDIGGQEDGTAGAGIGLLAQAETPAPQDADGGDAAPGVDRDDEANELEVDFDQSTGTLRVVPIPKEVWESLPKDCLKRMLEFESVREEYERTFGEQPPADLRDASQRLALEDIVDLALINSRDYQTAKETLYDVALTLSLERYDFFLKFATAEGSNHTDVEYTHNREAGVTEDTLKIPTKITGDKVLATGGDLLARFANDVVLTFNGPSGFAADIGSDLFLDISQSVFQRDIRFEELTQAERDVVYGVRNFARFRRAFFLARADEYYKLLLAYREIEIRSQDYFSNLRAFNQGEAELRAGKQSRIEVDQFEQTALSSRSTLIGRCNTLEENLDSLKLSMGLPPELPLNLDLSELDHLTLRDATMASGERVRRARRDLESLRQQSAEAPEQEPFLNDAIKLVRRMGHWLPLRQQLSQNGDHEPLLVRIRLEKARLRVDEGRVPVRLKREVLEKVRDATPPRPPIQVFRRTMDLVASVYESVDRQRELAEIQGVDPADIAQIDQGLANLSALAEQVIKHLEEVISNKELRRIPESVTEADAVLAEADALASFAETRTMYLTLPDQEELVRTLEKVDWLLGESERMLSEEDSGLVPVDIDMDDAMLTALVQRFDLINQRGDLADNWRNIKLAGDDLKSVLNLRASQTIGTQNNRPFAFSFDESETKLSLKFDAPLDRRAQRNTFRKTLINYNVALRNLMEAEDTIKFSVRKQLRDLQLGREQYQIAVASAALAYDRVVSTRLQLKLGMEEVSARDFLEAQQAYTASLNAVASEHIEYILDRLQLFLDLEELVVDDSGFWPELYRDDYQPTANYHLPSYALPAYGCLPPNVRYSHKVKRMYHVPTGQSMIFRPDADGLEDVAPPPELLPSPEPLEEPMPPTEPDGV
jgi:outer membrane protein TolC